MVLQLTMQEPKRVAELTHEFKKKIPPDATDLWPKCVVSPFRPSETSLHSMHLLHSIERGPEGWTPRQCAL